MRSRGSIVGPLILITIGVLFLMRSLWPTFSVFDFISVYWPYLLIIWGALQIIEITVRVSRGGPVPANGISGGGWFLVLLISVFGFGAYEIHGPQSWWRRVSFDQSMDWFGEPHDFAIPEQTRTAGKNPRVLIEDFRGSVKITGTDSNVIRLTGHKTIRAMKDGDANRSDRETPVELIEEGGNTVLIRLNQHKVSNKVRVSTDLDLAVPAGSSFEASGQAGDFDISNIAGDVKITSDNAGVRLQDIGGNVTVDTRHGDVVRCTNVKGWVDLKGRSSDVELEKIAGPVTINGAYSGTITLRQLARPVHVENFNTNLTVQKVNGTITMDRGSFSGEDIGGPAELTTRATDVEINGFNDSLRVSVDKGDISLQPSQNAIARTTVRTGSGNIDLSLPETAKFEVAASTDRGEIENEFGSPLKVEQAGRGAKLVGAVGTGPSLNLSTDRGTITIRKGNVAAKFSKSPAQETDEGAGNESFTPPAPPSVPEPPKNPITQKL